MKFFSRKISENLQSNDFVIKAMLEKLIKEEDAVAQHRAVELHKKFSKEIRANPAIAKIFIENVRALSPEEAQGNFFSKGLAETAG